MRIGFLVLSAALVATGAAHGAELTAKVTQLRGAVDLDGPGVPDPPRASLWQVLRAGVTVRVPERGTMGLLCSTRRFVRLEGPKKWSLNEGACAAGREVSPANYPLVASAPQFKVVDGMQILEREIRGGEDGDPLAPLVLSPRNTAIRTAKPSVSWTRVPSAVQYRVAWQGSGAGHDQLLAAESVACKPGPQGTEVCTLPWPAGRAGLPAGETFFLQVSAREELTGAWRDQGALEVRTLPAADAEALEGGLNELADLGLEGPVLATARAGLLASKGLYGEAAEGYRQALALGAQAPPIPESVPVVELRVNLADLNTAMGLLHLAEPEYRLALKESNPTVQAAASFGLGRVEYSRKRYSEAAVDFERACGIYSSQKLLEEEKAACSALKKARARIPR